ncbi:hypothetical protein [Nakamurella lactea]|uniref:hypothetical protein n=1 Tax=Nakamurella lactea TaxID=459515 RepID=UPI0003F4E456|nr:hypothetical protein [Nakamurella lactea]
MAAVFASLKWRLVTSRLRVLPPRKRLLMLLGLGVLALLLIGFGLLLAQLRTLPEAGLLVVTGLFSTQLVAWILTPLIAFGVDETVDPGRFAMLPIRPQQLQRGLLISSLVGYLPVANLIVLVGAAIGVSYRSWMIPLALVCAAVQLVTCVVFSRAAATSMAALMSSRRGRDLGMLVGFGVIVLYMLTSLTLGSGDSSGIGAGAVAITEALAWGPPGSLASLPALIATGQWSRAAVAVVVAALFLGAGWWWWSAALRRRLTSGESETTGSAPSRGLGNADAVAGTVSGTAQVIAGRDLTLMWRDPMRRMPWLLSLLMAIGWPLLVFRGAGAVYGCALGALLIGTQAANMYGYEGSGLWMHLVTFADRARARGEVIGHALSVVIPGVPVIVVSTVTVAAVRDDWANLPGALGVGIAAVGGAVAVGCYLSAVVPYAMPQSRKSIFASSVAGQKGITVRATLGTMLGAIVTALPAVAFAALALLVAPGWGWAALGVGLLLPPLLLTFATRLTAERYLESAPEILAVVSAGDRV